jgi:hypothetical protein
LIAERVSARWADARQLLERRPKPEERTAQAPAGVAEPFFPSHRHLLGVLDRERWVGGRQHRPGAIVVPTGRPATAPRSGLSFAARLALDNGCPLVVLASHEAGSAAAVRTLGDQITVETEEGDLQPDTLVLRTAQKGSPLTRFEADELPLSTAYRRGGDVLGEGKLQRNDVGRKRNLALMLARGACWRTVLFLDDDMVDVRVSDSLERHRHGQTLDRASLRASVRAVEEGGHLAVGWAGRDFNDNSVLCHMAALTGATQGQFIGGGALLTPVGPLTPHFPFIYNEDWLFDLVLLERREPGTREVLDGGDVHQDPYLPFVARRAAAEELGDILGEGMMSLLHDDEARAQLLRPAFWERALDERRDLKDRLRRRVTGLEHPQAPEMLKVLDVLDVIHDKLQTERDHWVKQFVEYVRAWRRDLDTWERRMRLDDVPSPTTLLHGREFDAARTFGTSRDPDDFVRRFCGPTPVDARQAVPLPV